MRKNVCLLALILCSCHGLLAQLKIEVPSQLRFADMRLNLTPEARKKVQTDVDALIRYEKYFDAKVKKVDAHLPLIEDILREENVPDDIKYLVIQESALVGDAVSTSNAVGYWQFKEATGREVGLTINRQVDERMNIVTATRGAAQYFKNNNTFFDNWLYALLAYYAGPGGALKIADKKYYGKREMKLDGKTHWYVIKYLAHKIAFENAVNRNPDPQMVLSTYAYGNGKTLAQVASELGLEKSELEPYNRWVRQNRIPDEGRYYVIVPDYKGRSGQPLLADTPPKQTRKSTSSVPTEASVQGRQFVTVDDTGRFPVVRQASRWGSEVTLVNNIPGVIAQAGDGIRAISQRTGVSPSRLVSYNDLTSQQSAVIAGKPYYLKRKRNKGLTHYHTVEPGETLWDVSQRFGIKLKILMRNNRMVEEEKLQPGRVLWLRFIRPPHIPIEYRDIPAGSTEEEPAVSRPRSEDKTDSGTSNPKKVRTTQTVYRKPEEKKQAGQTAQPSSEEQGRPKVKDEASPATQQTTASQGVSRAVEEKELVPVLGNRQSAKPDKTYHTVKAGETLYGIARQYDLTIPQLTSYNDIDWGEPLAVGQRLRLGPAESPTTNSRDAKEAAGKFIMHRVVSGETLYGIARQYDVTIKELMDWNNKEDFSVSVNEEIRVLSK